MPGRISNQQMVGVTAWRGTVTKENHLYGLFRSNPQMASNVMTVLMSSMHLPTLNTYLSKEVPVREYEDDSELHWDIVTSAERNIPLVECRRIDGTVVSAANEGNVGVGFEPFYLVFAEDWFALGEVLWGNLNELYPVIVKEAGKAEGTNTVYYVEPYGAEMADGIPAARLLPGEKFSWAYAPIERNFSRKVGDVRFSSPISMKTDWMRVRLQHKIGGEEIGKRLAANFPVTRTVGNTRQTAIATRWMLNVTWTIEETWEKYKSNALERGVTTRMENGEYSNFGLSGLANRQGAGFRQQIAAGHQEYYSKFTMQKLEDCINNLSAGKLDFKKRKFVVWTGERGAALISRAAKSEMSGWLANTDYTQAGVSITNPQVTKWISANGAEVTIMIDSSRDDETINKVPHPLGGPAESYRMDIFYAADEDQPNVQKAVLKGNPERRGYQWGPFYNPFTGEANNGSASFDEDAATVHYKATFGLIVYDPTRCIALIPNILRG